MTKYFMFSKILMLIILGSNTVSAEVKTFNVKNLHQFLEAVNLADAHDNIHLLGEVEFNLTEYKPLRIKKGVRIYGDRESGISKGALLYSTDLNTLPLLSVEGTDVIVEGLRLRGPDDKRREKQMKALSKEGKYYTIPNSRGLSTTYARVTIQNCEIWGWSHAGIHLKNSAGHLIRSNYIHHNQRQGLGYGIVLDGAEAIIEKNIFDWNRHSISASGVRGTSYIARYNQIKKNANGHAFDVHGGKDRRDGTNIAGNEIKIHDNVFEIITHASITIRGTPTEFASIYNNCFQNRSSKSAIRLKNNAKKVSVYNNKYGNCNKLE